MQTNHARKCDLAGDTVFQGSHAGGRRSWLWIFRGARAGNEGERHAVDFGVLGVEGLDFQRPAVYQNGLLRWDVAHAAKAAADYLLAKKLRAECSNAENVRHGVCVPAFCEHRDRHYALDLLAEFFRLADCVHYFAKDVLVREVFDIRSRKASAIFIFKFLDFDGGDFLEFGAHGAAGFELLAVHQDGVRTISPSRVLDVAEEIELSRDRDFGAVREYFLPSSDVAKDEVRDVGVIANYDENWRRESARPSF